MIASNHKDKDGFRLQFEENTSESEREFYMKMFPNVDTVAKHKIHCTVCDVHIGTAPLAEKIIRAHPCLNVTHCNKCFAFYNSGEFGKGEDGSEYYCRWCGQGGEVYCCSQCPFVFCSKCIKINLSQEVVDEIENNEDWPCFVCAPKAIWHLKAQHWALVNYIDKQTQKIKDMNLISEGEINYLLSRDSTNCCQKKRIEIKKPVATAPVKRKSTNGIALPQAKKPTPIRTNGEKNNDEVVCTPDIFSMFNEQDEQQKTMLPKTTTIRPVGRIATPSTAPPPLAIRQTPGLPRVRFPGAPGARMQTATGGAPAPVFHTIGGFRIDLNHAARQEIFRLPNGKLIQVRKQVTNAPAGQGSAQSSLPSPVPVGVPTRVVTPGAIRPMQVNRGVRQPTMNSRMQRPQTPQVSALQPRFLISDATPQQIAAAAQLNSVGASTTTTASPGVTSTPAPLTQTGTTIFQQQNGSIIVNRAQHPDTAFGKAKTSFEDKIISGMEICQHTINKMITLTNSSSFKQSKNFQDLKELYIHLKYLYSFTIGKFNTLQEKLSEDMEKLAENDPQLNKNDDEDDDFEIVENKMECIDVVSSDEESNEREKNAQKKKTPRKQTLQPKEVPDTPEKIEVAPDLPMSLFDLEPMTSRPASACSNDSNTDIISDDPKLQKNVVIKTEKLEERYPYINGFLNALKESEKETIRVKLKPVGDEDCFVVEKECVRSESETEDEGEDSGNDQEVVGEKILETTADESDVAKINGDEPQTIDLENEQEKMETDDGNLDETIEKEPAQDESAEKSLGEAVDEEKTEETQEETTAVVDLELSAEEVPEKSVEEVPEKSVEEIPDSPDKPHDEIVEEILDKSTEEIPDSPEKPLDQIPEETPASPEKPQEEESLTEPLNPEEDHEKPADEASDMDFQQNLDLPALEDHDNLPEASELLAENGMGEINDFDADDLLGDDNLDLPELDEKLEKEVTDISNELLDTPMETD
jgi:hypothetical protein